MAEKKQVVYDLRTTYNGPFVVEEFYSEVDNWIKQNGLEKELKSKMEHLIGNGKKIEWVIEAHSHLDDQHHGIVILRAMLNNIQEAIIKKGNKKIRINNGDVFINIDGFVQSHIHGSFWQIKPVYYFIRTLINNYIYNFSIDKYDGVVAEQCNDLFKNIRSFFNLQKERYER